jgi:acid phosphatase type 7
MEPGHQVPLRLYWGPAPGPEGWVRLAGPEGAAPDLTCNIVQDGLPFAPECIERVLCRFAPQSLSAYELLQALREIWRVLEPGGRLRLDYRDLDKAIAAYKAGERERFWPTDWSTLSGKFITEILEHNEVLTPLTPEFARELLEAAGFEWIPPPQDVPAGGEWPEVQAGLREMSSFAEGSKPGSVEALKARIPVPTIGAGTAEVHVSWGEDPATTLKVLFRMSPEEDFGHVEYRADGAETWARAVASRVDYSSAGVLHEATIGGLEPGSNVDYRVLSNVGPTTRTSEVFRTRLAPSGVAEDFTFAFLCDTGIAERPDGKAVGFRRVIHEILACLPLFILGGGDYAYSDRDGRFSDAGSAVSAWFRQMEPLISRVPFLAQFGNHDTGLGERYRDWAPAFGRPREGCRHYSFDVMDAHFAGLYAPGPVPEKDDLDWIDRDLELARERGARWLIVWQHEPIFACGRSHPADPRVRDSLAPLFERHRVDLHLSGHDQSYERTHPLTLERDVFSWTHGTQESYEQGSGVIYAKVSPGGKLSDMGNDFSRFTRKQQSWMAARDDSAHHYAVVTVRAKGELHFEAFAVSVGDAPARRIDAFRIQDALESELRRTLR